MKKSNPIRVEYFLFYWVVFVLIVGCFTQKRANKLQDRIIEKFPLVAASKMQNRFPVKETVITVIDSADYVRQRDLSIHEAAVMRRLLDSIRKRTESFPEAVKQLCGDYELIIDGLTEENRILNRALSSQKPVIVHKETRFEDSSKLFVLNSEINKLSRLYSEANNWKIIKEKKEKGKLVILIPWWLILVVVMSVVAYLFFSNNKTFNWVKLFSKIISIWRKQKKPTDQQ